MTWLSIVWIFRVFDWLYVNLNKDQIKEEYLVECQEKIDEFIEVFDYLKFCFNQSKTPKIHTIESHVLDYIKLTGKPLGSLDQCIESVHQYFDQRMNSSKYKVKEKSSDVAGDKLLKLVLHFNAYNLFNWFNKSHILTEKLTRCHKRCIYLRTI